MTEKDLIEQMCNDLNQAHDEICKLQGLDPTTHDWPEWTPQANSIRIAEKMLRKKLAKTDQWTLFPCWNECPNLLKGRPLNLNFENERRKPKGA